MQTLNDIIQYEEETTTIEFKKIEYVKENYSELLKDVMAMANSHSIGPKYIIFGVKLYPDSPREFFPLKKVTDQANLENIIQENIEPIVPFKYYSYDYKGKQLAILELDSEQLDRPYIMSKDYKHLKKGDIFIRKGSRISKISRDDLNRMYLDKHDSIHSEHVRLNMLCNSLECENMERTNFKNEDFPSSLQRIRLIESKNKLEEFIRKEEESAKTENNRIKIPILPIWGAEYSSSDKSIRVGYSEMGLPVYNDVDRLNERIKSVKSTFYDDDYYFLFEEKSIKVNFNVNNNNNFFMENVKFEFVFDSNVFSVSEYKPFKPAKTSQLIPNNYLNTKVSIGYPNVEVKDNNFIVTEFHKSIRHKEDILVFSEDLRVIIKNNVKEGSYKIKYKISAKNMLDPIIGEIEVNIEN